MFASWSSFRWDGSEYILRESPGNHAITQADWLNSVQRSRQIPKLVTPCQKSTKKINFIFCWPKPNFVSRSSGLMSIIVGDSLGKLEALLKISFSLFLGFNFYFTVASLWNKKQSTKLKEDWKKYKKSLKISCQRHTLISLGCWFGSGDLCTNCMAPRMMEIYTISNSVGIKGYTTVD